MWEDPIVKEVRRIREEHSARFGHDLDRIYRELKKQEEASDRRYVAYAARPAEPLARVQAQNAARK
jgi:hypothetical protein